MQLFRKICAAVHYAHQHLVIHRDLKPSNILVTKDGEPKLLDFGIAKLIDTGTESSSATGFVMATPQYASPELLDGQPVTTATDVYSLGVILYRILTGCSPYGSLAGLELLSAILKGDIAAVGASGEKGVLAILAATHAGMTTDEFTQTVQDWITTAKHPQTGRLYTDMVYQPMQELLAYLRANGFKTFIVSGGGVEFMRPWAERVYGIPPEQVVGSAGKMKLETREGKPVLIKLPEVDLIDDKEGKPVGIQSRIGRRPIAAFGNSDGDLQMLEWTMAGGGARLALFVHHDDATREYAYDRGDTLQQFNKGWDEAIARGWTVVSMKDDWKVVYPVRH